MNYSIISDFGGGSQAAGFGHTRVARRGKAILIALVGTFVTPAF